MKKGFTIIEILATLLFVSVLLVSLIKLYTTSVNIVEHNYLKKRAIDLAVSSLEMEQYAGMPLVELPTTNVFTVQIIPDNDNGVSLDKTVIISWQDSLASENSIKLKRTFYAK